MTEEERQCFTDVVIQPKQQTNEKQKKGSERRKQGL